MRINYYYKVTNNPILGALIIGKFIEGYGKPVPYDFVYIILPLIFSDKIRNKLKNGNSTSTFYTMIKDNYYIDLKKELLIKSKLTKLSIIYGTSSNYFALENGLFRHQTPIKTDNKLLSVFLKSSNILGKTLGKLQNEKEIFYHLANY